MILKRVRAAVSDARATPPRVDNRIIYLARYASFDWELNITVFVQYVFSTASQTQ